MSVKLVARDTVDSVEIGPYDNIVTLLRSCQAKLTEFFTGSDSDFFRVELYDDTKQLLIIEWRCRTSLTDLLLQLGVFAPGVFNSERPPNFE